MEKGRAASPGSVPSTSRPRAHAPQAPSASTTASLKYLALVLMILQNTSLSLLVRYSRVAGADRYFSSVAVVLAELVKVAACLVVLLFLEALFLSSNISSIFCPK